MKERGQFGAVLVVVAVILVLALVGLFAVCTPGEDDHGDSLGIARVADHDGSWDDSRCYRYGDCRGDSGNEGEYRDDNRRGGISPGPFDRSPVDFRDNRVTICFPFSRCDSEQQPPEEGSPPD